MVDGGRARAAGTALSAALATLHRDLDVFGVDVMTIQWNEAADQLDHLLVQVGTPARGGVKLRLLRDLRRHRALNNMVWGMTVRVPDPVRPLTVAGLPFVAQRNQHTGAHWTAGLTPGMYVRIALADWPEILDDAIGDAQDIARGRTIPLGGAFQSRVSPWDVWAQLCQNHGVSRGLDEL